MPLTRGSLALSVLAAALACSESDPGGAAGGELPDDAGGDAGCGPDGGTGSLPESEVPPVGSLADCPADAISLLDGGCRTIGPRVCPGGFVRQAGAGCVEDLAAARPSTGPDASCPRPAFDGSSVEPEVVHVAPGADGDGSPSAPTSLAAAVQAGATRLALHAGTYELTEWPQVTQIEGRCVQDVSIRLPAEAFLASRGSLRVAGVTLEVGQGGLKAEGLSLTLEDVLVRPRTDGATMGDPPALILSEVALEARRVGFAGVRLDMRGDSASLDQVEVTGTYGTAVRAAAGADVTIIRSTIRDLAIGGEAASRALVLEDATARLQDSVIRGCPEACVIGSGSDLEIHASWIGGGEAGVSVTGGEVPGSLTMEDSTIAGVAYGIIARGPAIHVVRSAVVDLTEPPEGEAMASGMVLLFDPETTPGPRPVAVVEGTELLRNRYRSVVVAGYDVTVSGSRVGQTDFLLAAGTRGGRLAVTESLLEAPGAALVANLPDAASGTLDVSLTRSVVRQSPDAPAGFSALAAVGSGVRLRVERSRLAGGAGPLVIGETAGEVAVSGSTLTLEGYPGPALALSCEGGGAQVSGNRIEAPGGVSLSRCHGASFEDNDIVGAITGLLVCRTRAAQVARNRVLRSGGPADAASGLVLVGNAGLSLRDNTIHGGDGFGVSLFGGSAVASGNVISENLEGGVLVHDDAHLTLEPPLNRLQDNRRMGVDCAAGTLSASEAGALLVVGTARRAKDGTLGYGLLLRQECQVSLPSIAVSGSGCADVVIGGADGALDLADACHPPVWASHDPVAALQPPAEASLAPAGTCPAPPPALSWSSQPEPGPCAWREGDP